jgi:hypothetical protein
VHSHLLISCRPHSGCYRWISQQKASP